MRTKWQKQPDSEGFWWFRHKGESCPIYVQRDKAGFLVHQVIKGMLDIPTDSTGQWRKVVGIK